jgi:hypothetical protein
MCAGQFKSSRRDLYSNSLLRSFAASRFLIGQ